MASTDPVRPLAEFARPRMVAEPRNLTLEARRALAHPARMELVAHIAARGPLCSSTSPATWTSQSAISKHLGTLRRAGLVESRREGRWVYHSIRETALDAAHGFLDDLKDSMHRPHVADDCSPRAT
jgi:DNA-binding transcriptional ArsR family regulator